MRILQANYKQQQQTNFKATYPVVHWVAETNGSYAPVSNLHSVKKLQGKIIRILNKSVEELKKPMVPQEQNIRSYIARCDIDYRTMPKVRTFYNREESNIGGNSYSAYIISGKDIEPFEDSLAKNIGIIKHEVLKTTNGTRSPEANAAVKLYNTNGLHYVNDYALRIKDVNSGMTYVLHTKFQIIRNKLGKIKDFKFIDARFLPEKGPENPFEKLKR